MVAATDLRDASSPRRGEYSGLPERVRVVQDSLLNRRLRVLDSPRRFRSQASQVRRVL
jgi:hypothetical protein